MQILKFEHFKNLFAFFLAGLLHLSYNFFVELIVPEKKNFEFCVIIFFEKEKYYKLEKNYSWKSTCAT